MSEQTCEQTCKFKWSQRMTEEPLRNLHISTPLTALLNAGVDGACRK